MRRKKLLYITYYKLSYTALYILFNINDLQAFCLHGVGLSLRHHTIITSLIGSPWAALLLCFVGL
jgi:hypothetical protein